MKNKLLHIILILFSTTAFAQVNLEVDTTHIRIGEQIQYELSTDEQADVLFPKLKLDSLGRVEVVHSLPVDTLKKRLYKKYILTSFDSGSYRIPAQKVFINNKIFLTDSILIHVGTVAVDTTKQKLFPIKPIYKAPDKTWHDYIKYLWWLLSAILLLGILGWLIIHYRKQSKKRAIPVLSPIEIAYKQFETLDKKKLIEQQKIKDYYVELTDIVRDYIGKDVHIPTMEVTTDELITLLSLHNKSNKIGIDKERITQLHQFLKTADLVKFAKSKPELPQIQEDRQTAERVISEIQSLIHKPVLDELGNEIIEETQEYISKKTSKKRRLIAVIIGIALILITILGAISYYGFNYLKDTFIGHPTKELLEGEWYQSSYGYPAIGVETPVVLKAIETEISPEERPMLLSNASFSYGSISSGFYILLTTAEVNGQIPLEQEQIIANSIQMIESEKGVSSFTYDQEPITISGIEGVVLKATFKLNKDEMKLKHYIFIKENSLRQITIANKKNDTYAKEIQERIEKSIVLE